MRRYALSALWVVAGAPGLLGAQGFGIYEQGTCAMGRAGTGVAAPCADGSAMFFNPAGLAGLTGSRATLGVTLIDVHGNFTDDVFRRQTDIENPLIPIPQVYITHSHTPKLGVGVGVFAPYGLQTRWPLSFDGRFAGYDNILRSIYIQPTVAYQVTPWLSLGGGLDIVLGKVELRQRLDLADVPVPTSLLPPPPGSPPFVFGQFGIAPGTDFADAHLEATKTTVTAHWGAIIKVNDKLSLGGRYLMHAKFDYEGTADFTPVQTNLVVPANLMVGTLLIPAGTRIDDFLALPPLSLYNTLLADQPVATQITNPEQLVLGVAYKPHAAWTVLGDYQFTRWGKRFSVLKIDFAAAPDRTLYERYDDTNGFRLGAEWVKDAKWTFRGGYLYHDGAAPPETVTPLLPEGDRNEFSAGATVQLARGFSADLAYQFIKQNDRRGRTREAAGNVPATTDLNNGLYTLSAHLFGLSLSYTF